MSDLIERLRKWGNSFGLAQHYLGTKSAREDCAEAATALAEAEAEIERQQVMLDRALEASFNDKARADRLEALLPERGPGETDAEYERRLLSIRERLSRRMP